jgi:hypothetical protein
MGITIGDGRHANPLAMPRAAAVSTAHELIAASGLSRSLNATGAAVLIKSGAGRLCRVFVDAPGSTAAAFHDAATVGGASAANLIFVVPSGAPAGSVYCLDAPFASGLVAIPGSSGVLAIVWT